MAEKLETYFGTITYNKTIWYKNNTKKRFMGYIVMLDEFHNETSYKMVSFRSQVCIQSDTLGEKGMQGMKCKVQGYFKINDYNSESNWELWIEKLYIDGREDLAAAAEAAATPLPKTPPGALPTSPTAIQNTGPAPIPMVQTPQPLPQPLSQPYPTQPQAPIGSNVPSPVQGYIMPGIVPQPIQTLQPVGTVPQPVGTKPVGTKPKLVVPKYDVQDIGEPY